jgi:hypothetical protein
MRIEGKLELSAMLEQNGKRTFEVRGWVDVPLIYAPGDIAEFEVTGGAMAGKTLSLRLEAPEEYAMLKREE